MIRIKMEFEMNQKVSSHLSIILLMLLAFLVAWQTVVAASKVEKNTSEYLTNNLSAKMKAMDDVPVIPVNK
jgi:hypothetical protein